MKLLALPLLFFALISLRSFGQSPAKAKYNISGRVVDRSGKMPLPGASVFLGNATIGSETDKNGAFILSNVGPGNYTLIVSLVGYEIMSQPITITSANLHLPDIEMGQSVTILKEVKVTAKTEKSAYAEWARETFLKEFLGTTDYAKDCVIRNPEVLNISYDESTNTVKATSSDFLLIDNNALGYNLKYQLKKFEVSSNGNNDKNIHYEGSAFFTEMKGSPKQQKLWKDNRQAIYDNSSIHFLRALLDDRLETEGFRVYRLTNLRNPDKPADGVIDANISRLNTLKITGYKDSLKYWEKLKKMPGIILTLINTPLAKAGLVGNTDRPGIYRFGNNGDPLVVIYNKFGRFVNVKQLADLNNLHFILNKPDNKEFTLISFNEPYAYFDDNGGLFNPNSLTFEGAWIGNRIANLLPVDYSGDDNSTPGGVAKKDTLLQHIINGANAAATATPVEKVYLHLDRQYYMPGDTVWFKAYAVVGQRHELSEQSGVLYTELIDNRDSVISRHTIRLASGLGIGDIGVPIVSKPGSYRIRAYTRYMQNAGSEFFDEQYITIGGEKKLPPMTKQNQWIKPDVQFLPEGGELVVGVNTRVAVKAVNARGLGENITGKILDDNNNEITSFGTVHLGMGVFDLMPQEGKKYRANITCTNGTTFSADLPVAAEKRYSLAVDNSRVDSLYIKVTASDKAFAEDKDKVFYLVGRSGGGVVASSVIKMTEREVKTQVSKSHFPTGIAQFTLLNKDAIPLNERLVFVKNDDTVKLSLSASSTASAPRQKVMINLSTLGSKLSGAGSYSVSVINESRVPVNSNAESTILSNLLLTSDLKGYVEQPGYYFLNNSAKAVADLDLLMLTQGYRKFEWKPVTYTANRLAPQTSLSVTGSVKAFSGKPATNARVILLATHQNLLTDTVTDANGKFAFNNITLPDSAEIVVRANKQNNSGNVEIKVDGPGYAGISPGKIDADIAGAASDAIANYQADYLKRMSQTAYKNGMLLKEVNINRNVKVKPNLMFSANLNGPGHADQVIMYDQIGNCIDLATCLDGKVFGVHFKNGDAYNNRNQARLKLNPDGSPDVPPLAVVIDGLVTEGRGRLNALNPNDIFSIEVLRSGGYTAIYGSGAYSGALVITTKRGNEPRPNISDHAVGLIDTRFSGYYPAKIFYSPKYVSTQPTQITDARSTIFWEPELITDKDGKASFEYYNADTKGVYRVVVEGIDNTGSIGRQLLRYEVK